MAIALWRWGDLGTSAGGLVINRPSKKRAKECPKVRIFDML